METQGEGLLPMATAACKQLCHLGSNPQSSGVNTTPSTYWPTFAFCYHLFTKIEVMTFDENIPLCLGSRWQEQKEL